jgi:hypothetical protein
MGAVGIGRQQGTKKADRLGGVDVKLIKYPWLWFALAVVALGCAKTPTGQMDTEKLRSEIKKAHEEDEPEVAEMTAGRVIQIDELEIVLDSVFLNALDTSTIKFKLKNVSKTRIKRLHLPLLVSFTCLPKDQHGNFYYQLNRKPQGPRWDEKLLYPGESTETTVVIERLIDVPDLTLTVNFQKEVFGCAVRFKVPPEFIRKRK